MKLLDSLLKSSTNGKKHENVSSTLSSSKNAYSNLSFSNESKTFCQLIKRLVWQ